jgi:aminomethyltransferase
MEAGDKPYSNQLVGFVLGGKPIEEYAPDFWLVSEDGTTPIGYLTSPWYSPELETNIAMGYVPYEKKDIGNKFKFHLPNEYCDTPDQPVDGEIVEMPFRPSVNPNAREIAKSAGRDTAF